jgi:hypothetical protein
MTPHAHVRRGDAREARRLRSAVTIDTGDLVVADVVSVIELDGLIDRLELSGIPRTTYVKHEPHE